MRPWYSPDEPDAERDRLRVALNSISSPCPFCDRSSARITWCSIDRRHTLKVVHDRCCPVLRRGVWKDRAESFLVALLQLHGCVVAEYCDDLIERHEAR